MGEEQNERRNLTWLSQKGSIRFMEFETAVERERETQYQEVAGETLKKLGWKLFKRTDGHVFTILVPQVLDANEAFERGHVFAKHQMRAINGRELLSGAHIDHLTQGKLQKTEIMSTEYNPSIGHTGYIVLEKAS